MDDDKSSQDLIDQLTERVSFLENTLREQLTRLYAIERYVGLTPRPVAPRVEKTAVPDSAPPSSAQTAQPTAVQPPSISSLYTPLPPPRINQPSQASQATRAAKPQRWANLENLIGGRWLLWVGVLAIAFGMAFFLKLAIENEWIGPTGQVGIGVLIGLAFLAGGERLRARYPVYGYGLSGGGIMILYLSIYAAFAFYHLLGTLHAFIYMVAVTVTAALLSARYNALAIAILGLIGGFLTPILLSTGVDNQTGLFTYIALLDAGVLALAYSKHWRSLNYLAFISTVLMFVAWWVVWYTPEKLWTTIFFLTLFFALFALLAVLYNVINRRLTGWLDLLLVFLNGLIYFSVSYALLDNKYRAYLGLFAALVSAFYLALGYFTYIRDREDRLLVYTFFSLSFLFLVLAVPIQLDQHWVTMGWAIEGAALSWIGLKLDDRTSRYASLVVFVIAALHWGLIDVYDFAYATDAAFTPILNRRALSCAVLVGALAVAAWFYKRFGSQIEENDRSMITGLYVLGANALALTLLSIDINDYFQQRKAALSKDARFGTDFGNSIENGKQFTLSALWVVYGAAILMAGIKQRLKLLRYAALALLGAAAVKVIAIDLRYYDAPWHSLVFNQTFAAFALVIAALALGVWLYSRAEDVSETERTTLVPIMIVAANGLAIIALSAESSGYFQKIREAADFGLGDYRNPEFAAQLSLSLIWTVYGGALLTIGIIRRSRLLRIMGLLLLGLTIVKVFFLDLSSLERVYRIISFIVLGAILLAVSFLYQRLRRLTIETESTEEAN
jgi:uncharacterized membrane protein